MRKRKWTDRELAEYYETHSFAPDMIEAKKNGTMIVTQKGENVIEAILRHQAAEKKTAISKRTRSDYDTAAYYDTHSIVPDMLEAARNGTLIFTKPGESALDVIMRRRTAAKKAATKYAVA